MSGDASSVEFNSVNQDLGERLKAERQLVDHSGKNVMTFESALGEVNDPFDWVLKKDLFEKSPVKDFRKMIDTNITSVMALSMVCGVDTGGKFTNLEANVLYALLEARNEVLKIPQKQKQRAISAVASALGTTGAYIEPRALIESIQRLSDLIKASMPVHGGFADGALHIIKAAPLGQKGKEDPTLVRQNALDVSVRNTRYDFAPEAEFFNPATGAIEIRPMFETITYVDNRGVIVLDPNTGNTSDVLQPDAFVRETKHGGLFSLNMNTARHTIDERNSLITAMVKDALRETIAMLGTATPAPEGAQADVGVLTQRRQALEEKLKSLQ